MRSKCDASRGRVRAIYSGQEGARHVLTYRAPDLWTQAVFATVLQDRGIQAEPFDLFVSGETRRYVRVRKRCGST